MYVQLLHEQEHGKDYMSLVLAVATTVAAWAVTGWAVVRNLKDANRAESLGIQIVTIKEDCKTRIEHAPPGKMKRRPLVFSR